MPFYCFVQVTSNLLIDSKLKVVNLLTVENALYDDTSIKRHLLYSNTIVSLLKPWSSLIQLLLAQKVSCCINKVQIFLKQIFAWQHSTYV